MKSTFFAGVHAAPKGPRALVVLLCLLGLSAMGQSESFRLLSVKDGLAELTTPSPAAGSRHWLHFKRSANSQPVPVYRGATGQTSFLVPVGEADFGIFIVSSEVAAVTQTNLELQLAHALARKAALGAEHRALTNAIEQAGKLTDPVARGRLTFDHLGRWRSFSNELSALYDEFMELSRRIGFVTSTNIDWITDVLGRGPVTEELALGSGTPPTRTDTRVTTQVTTAAGAPIAIAVTAWQGRLNAGPTLVVPATSNALVTRSRVTSLDFSALTNTVLRVSLRLATERTNATCYVYFLGSGGNTLATRQVTGEGVVEFDASGPIRALLIEHPTTPVTGLALELLKYSRSPDANFWAQRGDIWNGINGAGRFEFDRRLPRGLIDELVRQAAIGEVAESITLSDVAVTTLNVEHPPMDGLTGIRSSPELGRLLAPAWWEEDNVRQADERYRYGLYYAGRMNPGNCAVYIGGGDSAGYVRKQIRLLDGGTVRITGAFNVSLSGVSPLPSDFFEIISDQTIIFKPGSPGSTLGIFVNSTASRFEILSQGASSMNELIPSSLMEVETSIELVKAQPTEYPGFTSGITEVPSVANAVMIGSPVHVWANVRNVSVASGLIKVRVYAGPTGTTNDTLQGEYSTRIQPLQQLGLFANCDRYDTPAIVSFETIYEDGRRSSLTSRYGKLSSPQNYGYTKEQQDRMARAAYHAWLAEIQHSGDVARADQIRNGMVAAIARDAGGWTPQIVTNVTAALTDAQRTNAQANQNLTATTPQLVAAAGDVIGILGSIRSQFVTNAATLTVTNSQSMFTAGQPVRLAVAVKDAFGRPVAGAEVSVEDGVRGITRSIGRTTEEGIAGLDYSSADTAKAGTFAVRFMTGANLTTTLVSLIPSDQTSLLLPCQEAGNSAAARRLSVLLQPSLVQRLEDPEFQQEVRETARFIGIAGRYWLQDLVTDPAVGIAVLATVVGCLPDKTAGGGVAGLPGMAFGAALDAGECGAASVFLRAEVGNPRRAATAFLDAVIETSNYDMQTRASLHEIVSSANGILSFGKVLKSGGLAGMKNVEKITEEGLDLISEAWDVFRGAQSTVEVLSRNDSGAVDSAAFVIPAKDGSGTYIINAIRQPGQSDPSRLQADPVDLAFLDRQPGTLAWRGPFGATYDVYLDGKRVATDILLSSLRLDQRLQPGIHVWSVVVKRNGVQTQGPWWRFTIEN